MKGSYNLFTELTSFLVYVLLPTRFLEFLLHIIPHDNVNYQENSTLIGDVKKLRST